MVKFYKSLEEQKQLLAGVLQNGCSQKFHKFRRKTLALESLFNKLQNTLGGCLWKESMKEITCSPVISIYLKSITEASERCPLRTKKKKKNNAIVETFIVSLVVIVLVND